MQGSKKDKILIIGAGFAGTATSMRLLLNAKEPIEVLLLERAEKQYFGGLAYSKSTAGWEHLFNIQIGRISVFHERPNDFLYWINEEADRSEWPKNWKEKNFNPSSAVARRIYQQYLEDRLKWSITSAAPDVVFSRVNGEVIDLVENKTSVVVSYIEGQASGTPKLKELEVDQAIIATGHIDLMLPPFVRGIENEQRFVHDQYSKKGLEIMQNLGKDETAFIIGTGLRAFDAVLSLLASSHIGPIIMCSRNGFTHYTYPKGHLHEIIKVRRPPFLEEDLTEEKLIAGVTEEFYYLINHLKSERSDIAEIVLPERILKAWEPYIVDLVARLPSEDVKRLLQRFDSLIVSTRTGTVPEIGRLITENMNPQDGRPPQVSIIKGDIQEMALTKEGHHFTVQLIELGKKEMSSLEVGIVICCVGQQWDYSKVKHPLWRNLVDVHKSAVPHKKTGRGIEVGDHGELVNAKGEVSRIVYAVGPMRQGDEVERRGRLGIFSLATIRKQARTTALTALDRLTRRKREQSNAILF